MGSGDSHIADLSASGPVNEPASESFEGSIDGKVRSDSIFRYLSLPQEIRQMIYGECFDIPDSTYKWLDTPLPGILLVSKAVRQEALEVFYKHSRFIINLDDRFSFSSWPRSAPRDQSFNHMARHLTRHLLRMRKLHFRTWLHGEKIGMHGAFDIDLQLKPVTRIKFHTFALERGSNAQQVLAWESRDSSFREESLAMLQDAVTTILSRCGRTGLKFGDLFDLKALIDGKSWIFCRFCSSRSAQQSPLVSH